MKSKYLQYRYAKQKTMLSKKVVAVVLSLLLVVSVFTISITSAFAANVTPFANNETIYFDTTDGNWGTDGITFKAYNFYADNDNWNVENDMDYTNSLLFLPSSLANAVTLEKVSDYIYKLNIPNGNTGAIMFMQVRTESGELALNLPRMYAKDKGTNNCVKLSSTLNGKWTTYTPQPLNDGKEVDAIPDTSITDNSNLYQVNATFFDYYTDDEVRDGWRQINYTTTHGDWEPYQVFNNKLATYAQTNSVKYPLYFGNFFDKNDGYVGYGTSALYAFKNVVNNSARLNTQYTGSVVGLTSPKLINNQLAYFGSVSGATETNGALSTLFDKAWLKDNGVGTIVNTKFPMRIEQDASGNTYYEFNSKNATDNIWFDNYDQKQLSLSYGAGTDNGVIDALDYYSDPKENAGYGFLPFDKSSKNGGRSDNRGLNFGFGMRVDIDFNVAMDGTLKNNVAQAFEFTGDDDVWVFVDGVLVLDLGGDHKEANGTINFKTLTSTVNGTGSQSLESVTRNGSFPNLFGESGTEAFNNTDTTTKHTLTMFYMERGLIESNLKFGFNFSPVGNQFVSEKQVDTAQVNQGISDAVATADEFTFTHSNSTTENGAYTASAGKTYNYAHNGVGTEKTTPAQGTYGLYDGDSASFVDQFETGAYFKVAESMAASHLSYTTKWTATDMVLQAAGKESTIATGDGLNSAFKFETLDTSSQLNPTKVKLTYTNTPVLGSVNISKTVKDNDGNSITDTAEFDANVTVSLDGGATFNPYPLQYTTSDSNQVYTLSDTGALADGGKLKSGRTITVSNLPVNAVVKVSETLPAGYHYYKTSGTEVTEQGNGGYCLVKEEPLTIAIENRLDAPGEVTKQFTAKKELSGANLTDNAFEFQLLNEDKTQIIETVGCDAAGGITFTPITYTQPGVYKYFIKEIIGTDSDVNYFYDYYEVVVTVTMGNNNTLEASEKYIRYYTNPQSPGTPDVPIDVEVLIFENSIKPGQVTVEKTAQDGTKLSDTTFAIYKVDGEGAEPADLNNPFRTATTGDGTNGTTLGQAEFTDIPIYKDGATYTPVGAEHQYQWYCLVEFNPKDGYTINSEKQYFVIPTADADGAPHYSLTYEYINGKIFVPQASGNGVYGYLTVGAVVMAVAILLSVAYFAFYKNTRKKRKAML